MFGSEQQLVDCDTTVSGAGALRRIFPHFRIRFELPAIRAMDARTPGSLTPEVARLNRCVCALNDLNVAVIANTYLIRSDVFLQEDVRDGLGEGIGDHRGVTVCWEDFVLPYVWLV